MEDSAEKTSGQAKDQHDGEKSYPQLSELGFIDEREWGSFPSHRPSLPCWMNHARARKEQARTIP